MKSLKKILSILFIFIFISALASCTSAGTTATLRFRYWNDCDSLSSLTSYVKDVTSKRSENYIPEEDRIAVFDMDGTLYGELFPTYLEYLLFAHRCLDDENYIAEEDMIETAELIRNSVGTSDFPSDMAMRHALGQAKAFAGMTTQEFEDYVKEFLNTPAEGFEGMTYGAAFYLPMIEVIDYLQSNGFKAYIVSGSDRFICRALASKTCNIPYERIIGMHVKLEAKGQNGQDSLNYQYTASDDILRTDTLLVKNLKTNKVLQIMQEIGRKPVLSFGNSSGDVSMHVFTTSDNKYKSQAYMLIANDEERDYGNTEKATKLGEQWEEYGFNVISMKDDFTTIYGENVKKVA